MSTPPKREHLRQLVEGKQLWSEPLTDEDRAKGFLGWHERGYLPHCDKPGLTQFVTFRLADSMPESRRGEWEHLLKISEADTRSDAPRSGAQSIALREAEDRKRRTKLEEYLDRGHGECHLQVPQIAAWIENAILHHHNQRFRLLAWVVMPNHVHVLVEVWQTPLARILQNWKSITAVEANRMLGCTGTFWQPEYWDRFMRSEEQLRKAIRYIENNPVKAGLCSHATEWRCSSARFRDEETRELKLVG